MLSLAPPFGAWAARAARPARRRRRRRVAGAGAGRVLAGGGAWLVTFCVVLGACDGELLIAAGMFDWLGDCGGCVTTFGSEPRPGGGGGFDGVAGGAFDGDARASTPTAAARKAAAAAPRCAAGGRPRGGAGGGRRPDAPARTRTASSAEPGGVAGMAPWLGGCAGPGMPISVLFMSAGRLAAATFGGGGRRGGGGGAADVRAALFLPRPSKISRSEPLLLSSDIRVS